MSAVSGRKVRALPYYRALACSTGTRLLSGVLHLAMDS